MILLLKTLTFQICSGLIQLLLGAKDSSGLMVKNVNSGVEKDNKLTDKDEEENERQLSEWCEGGFLNSIVEILNDLKDKSSRDVTR